MKFLPLIAAVFLTACAGSFDNRAPVHISGILVVWSYQAPSGEPMSSAAMELKVPIVVRGLSQPTSRIELILPEHYFSQWRTLVGREAMATCSLAVMGLWGYPHASCEPTDLRVIR